MSMDPKKSNKIREIVRLQQILKKWRKLANNSSSSKPMTTNSNSNTNTNTTNTSTSTSSKSMKFLKRTLSLSERSEGGTSSNNSNNNVVPKGFLAVCVGEELKRFIIPTEYLGHQAFQILLREAEEEFGFQQTGVLRIPCEVQVFESILKLVEGKKDKVNSSTQQECRLSVEEIMGYCSSSENQLSYSHHPQSPLCR